MLQPHYGWGMHQASALLLVPDMFVLCPAPFMGEMGEKCTFTPHPTKSRLQSCHKSPELFHGGNRHYTSLAPVNKQPGRQHISSTQGIHTGRVNSAPGAYRESPGISPGLICGERPFQENKIDHIYKTMVLSVGTWS